jgi:hypothetical protein
VGNLHLRGALLIVRAGSVRTPIIAGRKALLRFSGSYPQTSNRWIEA